MTQNSINMFKFLVQVLNQNCLMSLGLAKNPMTQEITKDLEAAKLNINILEMLFEKTKGNLTDEESKYLQGIITELNTKYQETIS